jgi:hypothetical protein
MSVPHEDIMQYFAYEHLDEAKQRVSKPFCELARLVEQTLPRCAERSVALRKLLEGKDAAVRASMARSRQEIKPADVGDVSSVLGAPAPPLPDVP